MHRNHTSTVSLQASSKRSHNLVLSILQSKVLERNIPRHKHAQLQNHRNTPEYSCVDLRDDIGTYQFVMQNDKPGYKSVPSPSVRASTVLGYFQ